MPRLKSNNDVEYIRKTSAEGVDRIRPLLDALRIGQCDEVIYWEHIELQAAGQKRQAQKRAQRKVHA